ncbi:transcriptional regulator [Salinisphaera orenii MK-B5]|uniref:Transcriptional regulator n=1 Tax=Salinisphaera orenii MK-B5 TaxID=856730 RepID=A0A423PNS8_9GAMM|nr:cyclic nucleotide-binding domain-containing protein [Salinisphaera orenii]ROO27274.1 transcriptional regulator [Salinisphaera orenii MK-B5]
MGAASQQLEQLSETCSHCSLNYLCLPYGLSQDDVSELERLVSPGTPVAMNAELFGQGDTLTDLYAIRDGSMKTVVVDEDGLEQILGFYYPGDLLGLDGFADQHHHCTAVALESTRVCRIPVDRLDRLVDKLPSLRHQIMRLMSQALSDEERLLLTLGRKNSEGRISSLLLTLSRRREMRGLDPSPVSLSMKRSELANFLSMRLETVSRVLTRLQRDGVIRVRQSRVDILDREALRSRSSRGAWAADQS